MDKMNLIVPQPTLLPPTSLQVFNAVYCNLEPAIGKGRQIRVACVGRECCEPDYDVKRHGYVCYGLELVVQGKGFLQIGSKNHALLPGHLFLYGPGIAHRIHCDPRSPMVKYFVDFSGNLSREFGHLNVIAPGEVRWTPELDIFRQLFDDMIKEGKKAIPARREICALQMKLLLLKTMESGNAQKPAYSQSFAKLSWCRRWIDEHATEINGLQDVAKAAHLDPRYICRLFKRAKLPSPYEYLVTCRMNRAAELLGTTNAPIKDVAAQCGYPDPLHFSRVFKNHFSFPPSEFRLRNPKFNSDVRTK